MGNFYLLTPTSSYLFTLPVLSMALEAFLPVRLASLDVPAAFHDLKCFPRRPDADVLPTIQAQNLNFPVSGMPLGRRLRTQVPGGFHQNTPLAIPN